MATTPTSVVADAQGDPKSAAEMQMHMYRLDAIKMMAEQGIAHPSESDIKAWAMKIQQNEEEGKQQAQMQQMQQQAAQQAAQPPQPNLIAPPPQVAAGMMAPGDAGTPLSQMMTAFGAR